MAQYRIVTAHFERPDGTDWAAAPLKFRLLRWSYLDDAIIPSGDVIDEADEAGDSSTLLWTNGEGYKPTVYSVVLPDGAQQEFVLPAGSTPISLPELFAIQGIQVLPDAEFLQLLAASIASIYAAFANTSNVQLGDALVGLRNTITGAKGRTLHSKLESIVDVDDFGAIGDGNSHPLSEFYDDLETALIDYPQALALTDETDWCAWQAMFSATAGSGKVARGGDGRTYIWNRQGVIDDDLVLMGNNSLIKASRTYTTALASAAAAGATTISVVSAANMAQGQLIQIPLTDGTIHSTWIRLISGTTITLARGLSATTFGDDVDASEEYDAETDSTWIEITDSADYEVGQSLTLTLQGPITEAHEIVELYTLRARVEGILTADANQGAAIYRVGASSGATVTTYVGLTSSTPAVGDPGTGAGNLACLLVSGSNVTIDGLRIAGDMTVSQNPYNLLYDGVYAASLRSGQRRFCIEVRGDNVHISNCEFTGGAAGVTFWSDISTTGIPDYRPTGCSVKDCTFTNTIVKRGRFGSNVQNTAVWIIGADGVTVEHNEINGYGEGVTGGHQNVGGDVGFIQSENIRILNNDIHEPDDHAVYQQADDMIISQNRIYDCGTSSIKAKGYRHVITENIITRPGSGAITVLGNGLKDEDGYSGGYIKILNNIITCDKFTNIGIRMRADSKQGMLEYMTVQGNNVTFPTDSLSNTRIAILGDAPAHTRGWKIADNTAVNHRSGINLRASMTSDVTAALLQPADPGDLVLTVGSTSGFANLDYVQIVTDDDEVHTDRLSAAPGVNTLTLTTGMPSAASIGTLVTRLGAVTYVTLEATNTATFEVVETTGFNEGDIVTIYKNDDTTEAKTILDIPDETTLVMVSAITGTVAVGGQITKSGAFPTAVLTTAAAVGHDASISVTLSSGFHDGNGIIILLDQGTWFETTVDGDPPDSETIDISPTVPNGTTIAAGQPVLLANTIHRELTVINNDFRSAEQYGFSLVNAIGGRAVGNSLSGSERAGAILTNSIGFSLENNLAGKAFHAQAQRAGFEEAGLSDLNWYRRNDPEGAANRYLNLGARTRKGSTPKDPLIIPRYLDTTTNSPHWALGSGGLMARWTNGHATQGHASLEVTVPADLIGMPLTIKAIIFATAVLTADGTPIVGHTQDIVIKGWRKAHEDGEDTPQSWNQNNVTYDGPLAVTGVEQEVIIGSFTPNSGEHYKFDFTPRQYAGALTTATATNTDTFTVDSTVGFVVGQEVTIPLTNLTSVTGVIETIPNGTTLVIVDAIVGSVAIGALIEMDDAPLQAVALQTRNIWVTHCWCE